MISILLIVCFVHLSASSSDLKYTFDTKYIDVPLDHFSFQSNSTFKLRYLINDTYYDKGPIFFYAGNEGDIGMFAQNTGFMFDIAPKFNASIVFAEHRYYGKSLPFGNLSYTSPEYLGYLSTTQALADFVYLINELQNTYVKGNDTKLPVIAFGGSYGGMLAAYLRMKYPYAVLGAIASSAPIWQYPYMADCGSFGRIATAAFEKFGGSKCSETISKSWDVIRSITQNASGKLMLSDLWKLCIPLETEDDVDTLINWLTNIYFFLAEVNYPYSTSFLVPLPPNPIEAFCKEIVGHAINTDEDVLRALGGAIPIYTNYTGTTQCVDLSKSASDDLGELGWWFQTCTDMIQNICYTDDDMFENDDWDFDEYSESCFAKFGVKPRSIDVPLLEFGGKDIRFFSNIVFSNGLMDPWSGLGVLDNITATVLAIRIKDGAHHADLRASHVNDTEDVKFARVFHIIQIYRWLDDYYQNLRK